MERDVDRDREGLMRGGEERWRGREREREGEE